MRITDVRVAESPIGSRFSNAVIDFSRMTVSVIAIETDVVVDGERVVGYGFNSNGRYAQSGILTGRVLPRLCAAEPSELADPETGLLDPVAARAVMMTNEKPGGHGDRAVAVGIVDMARGTPCRRRPAGRLAGSARTVAGGARPPGPSASTPQEAITTRAAPSALSGGDPGLRRLSGTAGQDQGRWCLARGGPRADRERPRLLPAGCRLAVDANGRFDLRTALDYAAALSAYDLLWFEEPCDPLDYLSHAALAGEYPGPLATGENLFAVPEVRNLARYAGLRPSLDILQMDPVAELRRSEYAAMRASLEAIRLGERAVLAARRAPVQPGGRRRVRAGRLPSRTPRSSSRSGGSPTTCPWRTAAYA